MFPALTEMYPLSLHDALPILEVSLKFGDRKPASVRSSALFAVVGDQEIVRLVGAFDGHESAGLGESSHGHRRRSEEHTSELQSLTNLVCRLLLEKKNRHPERR